MHSIARNAAWHGSRAQRERLITIRKYARAHRGGACNKHMQTYANACTKQNPRAAHGNPSNSAW
jgi:hypothetical protein